MYRKFSDTSTLLAILAIFVTTSLIDTTAVAQDTDAADAKQQAKDERAIKILMRLQDVDIGSKPKFKAVIVRHLNRIKGSDRFLELVEKFKVDGFDEDLLQLVAESDGNKSSNAARLLLEFGKSELLKKAIASTDDPIAVATVKALGSVGTSEALELIKPIILSDTFTSAVRNQAVRALGGNRSGQSFLLDLVTKDEMPKDLTFSFTNVLLGSRDAEITEQAAKFLESPETADSKPLPGVPELVTMQGDLAIGKEIFATKGTCANCHKVNGEGKEVGPDLTEIGSKLSRDAMFVSILNPSEGISHNYESYFVELESGLSDSGLLVSRTDDEIVLKNAEGVIRKFAAEEVLEFEKEKKSMMPDGLQKTMTVNELVSLVDYMMTLTKQE